MFQKWYNKNKVDAVDMRFEKKKSLTQLFLTDRLWSALGILILIFGVILVFAFLAGLVFVLTHTPKWVFLAFISEIHYCGPMFLITESSICLESKHYWHKLNKNRFALYDLEENLEEYDCYGVETRSWQKTGVVLAINNAAINRDIGKDKILTVWSKPLYNYVDFGFRVTPRCDSICGFTSNSHIINHKENIGRSI